MRKAICFVVSAALWLSCLHLVFLFPIKRVGVDAWTNQQALALSNHLGGLWGDAVLIADRNRAMASINPEWDFMARTFFVLGLANQSLRQPHLRAASLKMMDRIIEDTLAKERDFGFQYFLMPYGKTEMGWVHQPPASIFVDGEIALMMMARRWVEERPDYRSLVAMRLGRAQKQMRQSPVLCAESYPDECWLFCNTVALAAMRMADLLDGPRYEGFIRKWLVTSRQKLTDPSTGLLISAFTVNADPARCGKSPEGSSIWWAAHMLQIIDPEFAKDQYSRAKKYLARTFLGFGFSREWPEKQGNSMDVDSGWVVPGLEVSASASGLAVVAAQAFGDRSYLQSLLASLELAGFPERKNGKLFYRSGNTVGDAVVFYGMVAGSLWQQVLQKWGAR